MLALAFSGAKLAVEVEKARLVEVLNSRYMSRELLDEKLTGIKREVSRLAGQIEKLRNGE